MQNSILPRWTIDDLLVRYQLEPTLQDVFVEGRFDQEIITKVLNCHGSKGIVIYPSECVIIDKALLDKHRLTLGNKQRLIALSREIGALNKKAKAIAFVDRDLAHYTSGLEMSPNLRWTRYCDINCYFFSKRFVQEIVVESGQSKVDDFDVYHESIINICRYLSAFRLADWSLALNQTIIDLSRFISRDGSKVVFDETEFLTRVLNKNSNSSIKSKFCGEISRWLLLFESDFRLFVRGHDLIYLIALSIRLFKGLRSMADPEIIERILLLIPDRAIELVDDIS